LAINIILSEKPKTSQKKTFLIVIDKRYTTKRVMEMSMIKKMCCDDANDMHHYFSRV
jgi:hypothetical protein